MDSRFPLQASAYGLSSAETRKRTLLHRLGDEIPLCYVTARGLQRIPVDDVYYWAPAQARQLEVDFLLQRGRELLAIEVKTSPRLQPAQFAGLSAIAELPNVVRRILVYGGTRRLRTPAGIDVLPLANFLAALEQGKLWP